MFVIARTSSHSHDYIEITPKKDVRTLALLVGLLRIYTTISRLHHDHIKTTSRLNQRGGKMVQGTVQYRRVIFFFFLVDEVTSRHISTSTQSLGA